MAVRHPRWPFNWFINDRRNDWPWSEFIMFISVCLEESLKPPERQDTVLSFHTIGSSKEVTGSSSTLQVHQLFIHINTCGWKPLPFQPVHVKMIEMTNQIKVGGVYGLHKQNANFIAKHQFNTEREQRKLWNV